ncbi:MAG: ATP-binding protein [Clostridia bacterium]|nr:ATP-binding protein [Clostridia bacterium]
MRNPKIESIYKKLCLVSVFTGATEKQPVRAFIEYCESMGVDRQKAYARLVSEIYAGGGAFAPLVERAVFEDENPLVKSVARKQTCAPCIYAAAERELETFADLARLSPADFALDMQKNEREIPAFEMVNATLPPSFYARLENIGKVGYGIFSAHGMFRLSDEKTIEPILSADKTELNKFIGYEQEREKVLENTRAFVAGRPAANVLLYGDAGSGKSSTVKAVANAFFDEGVRLIELRKDQLALLPLVMGKIVGNPLKFIIFIDDLSFNRSDDHFSMLKAALEGSASAKADNAVIYATSNRRHIIKESFSDREGDDVHRNDTLQETLSLSERFGLTVLFAKPDKQLYLEIVQRLAARRGLKINESELNEKAEAFALKKGSRSARCAEQFVESLL